jgi:hypothetical protein
MADTPEQLKADRRGNTILVPIAIAIVFPILAGSMLLRTGSDGSPPADMSQQRGAKIQR